MLRLYYGEYLLTPIPVHLDLNTCTYGCFYCFANLSRENRRMYARAINRIANYEQYDTLESWFLSKGYPILCCNTSDPLAPVNFESFMQIRRAADKRGIKFCYQTKGGRVDNEDEIMQTSPSMFYVTLSSDKEEFLKFIEPRAPSFEHRMNLIKRLREKGHIVNIGLNPFVPHWWNDIAGTFKQLRDIGVSHVWTGELHLSSNRVRKMSEKTRQKYYDDIAYGMAKKKPDIIKKTEIVSILTDMGMNCYDGAISTKGGFWDEFFTIYPFMPTMDGYLTHVSSIANGDPIGLALSHFQKWANIGAPVRKGKYGVYIDATLMMVTIKELKLENKQSSFNAVHKTWWSRFADVPSRLRVNSLYLGTNPADGSVYVDDDSVPLLVFAPGCGDDWFHPITPDMRVLHNRKEVV